MPPPAEPQNQPNSTPQTQAQPLTAQEILPEYPAQYSTQATPPPADHRLRNGLLWIFSFPIVMITAIVINVVSRFLLPADGILINLANIVTWLTGIAAIILFFAGPIVGIIILAKKPK